MNGASGRTEGRAHRQSRDNQKFFNSMGYQIFLGMGLLSGALDAQEVTSQKTSKFFILSIVITFFSPGTGYITTLKIVLIALT